MKTDGIYIIGDDRKFDNSKYPNDKYDKELYIPKGYIIPDGRMLTREYGKYHEDIAKRFIEENYINSFNNDFIKDYKDYMLMRIHAIQVMSCGKNVIAYCDGYLNDTINKAITSYKSYGWEEMIVSNPTKSYYDYLRYHIFLNSNCNLIFDGGNYEEETYKQNILKRGKGIHY